MEKHKTLFITQRGVFHQQMAIAAAPPELEIIMRRQPAKEEILALLPECEFLISERSGAIDAEIIRAGKKLRLIQRLGAMTEDIDLETARQMGIPVCTFPVFTCVMVAEHMIMQMLCLAKRLPEMTYIMEEAQDWGKSPQKCDEDTFSYNWSERQNIRALYHSTIGIVGFGEIGVELALRLKGFACTVLYNKRQRLQPFTEEQLGIQYAELDDLLSHSDTVCLLLPYFPETEGIVNASFIAKMKAGSCLVCCGGSGILDEQDVAAALSSGYLSGVATDTYAWEPVRPDNPLLPLARQKGVNIILTPHTAAGSAPADERGRVEDYTNLVNVLQGKPLLYRVV